MKEGRLQITTKELCYAAVAVALLTVCSWISVPIGSLSITLQTLALFTVCGLLGTKRAFFAVLAYLLLGIIGVPVFAGFTGGIGKFFTPAGGYLIGFVFVAPLVGKWSKKLRGKVKKNLLAMALGTLVLYVFACAWWMVISAVQNASAGLWGAIVVCVLPYLLFDAVKIALAALLVQKLYGKIL